MACKERTKKSGTQERVGGCQAPAQRVISYTVHTITRSHARSQASYKRPRTRSLVHCVSHDPGQRGAPCSSTAFRRSTISRLNQWRVHQWRRWRRSLNHPLSEHLNSFSLLTHIRQRSELVKACVKPAREFIETVSAGRRGARIEGRHIGKCGNLFRDRKRINDLNSSDRKWRIHQIGDGTLHVGLRDWHVHNLFGGELLHMLMWKHFDGLNNLFLYPLHNLNLWNLLKKNMRLYCRNDLFLTWLYMCAAKSSKKGNESTTCRASTAEVEKLRVHQISDCILLLYLGDWHVHKKFGGALCHRCVQQFVLVSAPQ